MKKKNENSMIYVVIAIVVVIATILILNNIRQIPMAGNVSTQHVDGIQLKAGDQPNDTNFLVNPNSSSPINASLNSTSEQNISCQPNSIYFIYADWCPHCQRMQPLVSDLQSKGYRFVKVSVDNVSSVENCLADIAQLKYVPEFVCIFLKKDHVGEFTNESEMRAFADDCGALH